MDKQVRTSTTTQIRNLYSEEKCYLNIKFYNTSLSFSFYPYMNRDANGRSQYNLKAGQTTTVDFDKAFLLYKTATDILDGKLIEGSVDVPCNDANLVLERKLINGKPVTTFTINKNQVAITFEFAVYEQKVKNNGQVVMTTWIEAGLGAFLKTIEGYLTGINADRHLDKLTEDFVNSQNQNQGNNNNNYPNNKGQYKGYNNNGYKNNKYNNYKNNQNNGNRPYGLNTQSMSNYQLNN